MNKMNANIHKKRQTNPRMPFTTDEDGKLMKIIRNILKSDLISTNSNSSLNSTNVDDSINWMKVSRLMGNRTARQCKERYLHYLSPKINKNKWTSEEDSKLIGEVSRIGKRWKILEKYFNDRTEIDIRNRFYVLQRRISKAARLNMIKNTMKLDWLINDNSSNHNNNKINNNSDEISNDIDQMNDHFDVKNDENQLNNEFYALNDSCQNNNLSNSFNDINQSENGNETFFEFIYDYFDDVSYVDDKKNESNSIELFNGCTYNTISINNY